MKFGPYLAATVFAFVSASTAFAQQGTLKVLVEHRGSDPSYCKNTVKEIERTIDERTSKIEFDGQWFVDSTELVFEGDPVSLCEIKLMLKNSSYEFSKNADDIKPSFKMEKVTERVQSLVKEIQTREGYLWHVVEKNNPIAFYKGRTIKSLFLKKKAN